MRVLIADDNVDAADTMASYLAMFGHETLVAYDGMEALEQASARAPDLIILDIAMPRMNGWEACRQMRQLQTLRRPKIVALTAYGGADDRAHSKVAGFDEHFTKPLNPARLVQLLDDVAQGR